MFSDHYNVHVNIITYQDVGVSAQAGAVYIMELKKHNSIEIWRYD